MENLSIIPKDQTEISRPKHTEKEMKLIGSQRKIPGLTLWEFNVQTRILSKAVYKSIDFEYSTSNGFNQKKLTVSINENCIYFQALNQKNATKVLKRDFNIIFNLPSPGTDN